VIWKATRHDHIRSEVTTTTCPVLAFTPEVERLLQLFDDTHVLMNADGRYWWQPIAPFDGRGDSHDSHAIALLRRVHEDLVRPRPKADVPDTENG